MSPLPQRNTTSINALRLAVAYAVHDAGAQFMIPVLRNGKEYAWRKEAKLKPIQRKSIHDRLHALTPPDERGKRSYAYDLAVQTGTWLLPDRSHVLTVADIDIDLWNIPAELREWLAARPTLTLQSPSGHPHYFYACPDKAPFKRKVNKPGFGDWLARGAIAVITGDGRSIVNDAPIYRLTDAEAQFLRSYFEKPKSYPRHTGATGDRRFIPEQFAAVEGERYYQINRFLYHEFIFTSTITATELPARALYYAALCTPPYPANEALDIAESLIRNEQRLRSELGRRVQYAEIYDRVLYTEDYRYMRLARHFGKAGDLFTRADYSAALKQNGWKLDDHGNSEVARKDIEHNLSLGVVEKYGIEDKPGRGRKPTVYRRIKDSAISTDHLLPGKETRKTIRQSTILALMPTQESEVCRQTIAGWIGVKSPETISRYTAELASCENHWHRPLLNRKVRGFDHSGMLLDRVIPLAMFRQQFNEMVRFRPTVYRRLPVYEQLLHARASATFSRRNHYLVLNVIEKTKIKVDHVIPVPAFTQAAAD